MHRWSSAARREAVDAVFARAPVIPVISVDDVEQALPLAAALVEAGLPVLEVTLRTEAGLEAISRMAAAFPAACVGAGTVLTPAALEAVVEAGAAFAISPGGTETLYAAADDCRIPWIPAVATASELMRGMEHGHSRFKFFPAEPAGGVAALKSLAGPFPEARFCPTGGIDASRAPAWLALPTVATVGGSWMVPADAVKAGDWARIAGLAAAATALRG